ncbi:MULTISPECIES: acetyltransferase [Pseudomonas]|uniref:PglD-related sugar-binding protein n=1 Tax=Pseudomonas TaxID=286 RepID=UPI0009F23C5D|nr:MULTISPECIES: acetyltransferase [Pseudomonas]
MSQGRLLILGAGGHGKAVAEAAQLSAAWDEIVFVDDRWPALTHVAGFTVVASLQTLEQVCRPGDSAIAAVGNNALRERWLAQVRRLGIVVATVVHPHASVSSTAEIGEGCAVMALAMVGVDALLGEGVIINAHATVDHDACVEAYGHLGVGVHLAGGVTVGARAWLQAGCVAGYGVRVAAGVVMEPGRALMHEPGV